LPTKPGSFGANGIRRTNEEEAWESETLTMRYQFRESTAFYCLMMRFLMLFSSLLVLLAGATFSLPLPQPIVDTAICVPKPSISCDCETSNRIPSHDRNWNLISGKTQASVELECLDFCIWKFGRRQERRRLHAILRRELKELTLHSRSEPDRSRANRIKQALDPSIEALRFEMQ
jgi:hypothetical protein